MNKKLILINAGSSVLQVLAVGVVYFLLYKFLVQKLGAQELGVWSLVLATSSIANLANFGITSGLVKFVAEYRAKSKESELQKLVSTAFFSICVLFVILILLLYIVGIIILKRVVDANYLSVAIQILPYSLLSLFINGIGGIFTSVLEGFQKNYLRNIIFSIAVVVLYIGTFILTPKFGLLGVAYAQVIQSLLILGTASIIAMRLVYNKKYSGFKWDKETFKTIMGYGLKFQIVSICQMLYEPTTKTLLSKFGGLSAVGYYEMASRLISQVRALIVNANQIMIPVVTEASFNDSIKLESIYKKTFSITMFIGIPTISLILFLSPLISMFWIGKLQIEFIVFTYVLGIGNLFNIVCGPSYFGFLGQGILNPLIKVHVLMAIINAALAYLFGIFIGGYGVVIAWGIALLYSSLYLILQYNKINSFSLKENTESKMIIFGFLFHVILMIGYYLIFNKWSIVTVMVIEFVYFVIFFGIMFFKNKEFKKIHSLLYKK